MLLIKSAGGTNSVPYEKVRRRGRGKSGGRGGRGGLGGGGGKEGGGE